ncbi:methionyl-tRNA formyltransferase [Undibacterium cyanobacteriorum]|uniref:Methionyl-tRNA formyltransferase n=1 Tax=Undibacterium cyanobacteriorum TaxID=3073561 RepID=A0ABY9RGZ3_9BURK|nr:methionyl-tRNA formyltransferase [Undibacterium sp. 20NA77.5]WMW80480.1 methionyl-tRNA formyltransferase [Undibacterium sp. 20NA77.5]
MKVIFAGTPEFAATALEAIIAAGFEVPLVLTQPDRPAGRGMQLHASAVKQVALKHHIAVAQPISLRLDGKYPEIAQEAHDLLRNTEHDVMVVAAYGLILPLSVLSIPRLGCINIHGSLLPRWRGAAPIHRAIEAGDTETGITIMQMEEGLDTGPMLCRQAVPIAADDTTASLHDQLAELGGSMIVQALKDLKAGVLTPEVQDDSLANYAAKISKEEATLDFALSAEVLNRKIRAFNPFPAAQARINDVTLKIWKAEVDRTATFVKANGNPSSSGEILRADGEGVLIACAAGSSVLRITELQKPGGKRLPAREFLQGFPLEVGGILH